MRNNDAVGLEWAFIEGELRHIGEYAQLLPAQRPQAFCPICKSPGILKLGQIRRYHFAHAADIDCSATNPESALHFNSKFHLYSQLKDATEVLVANKCTHCNKIRSEVWLSNWDEIVMEYPLQQARPDLAFLRNGQLIGVIEVFVTHEVSKEKAIAYHQKNIRWIELQPTEDFYSGKKMWIVSKPLHIYKIQPQLATWVCQTCQENLETKRKQQEYNALNHDYIHCSKLVDLYFRSGKKYRRWYFIKIKVRDGNPVLAYLTRNGERKFIGTVEAPITKETIQKLTTFFEKDIRKANPLIIDRFMEWRLWRDNKFHERDFDQFPFRYEWVERKKEWEKIDFTKHIAPTIEIPSFPYQVQPQIRISEIDNRDIDNLPSSEKALLKAILTELYTNYGKSFHLQQFVTSQALHVREKLIKLNLITWRLIQETSSETSYEITAKGLLFIQE